MLAANMPAANMPIAKVPAVVGRFFYHIFRPVFAFKNRILDCKTGNTGIADATQPGAGKYTSRYISSYK